MKFLKRYERAARTYQATDYDKALQIGRFVQMEELKSELEAMDRYDECVWKKLRKDMVESWGELDDTVLYTTANLIKVAEEYSREGQLSSHREYKAYLGKFTTILKYLVSNEHINKKEDASLLFLSAFSKESQKNIRRSLVSQGRLPKGKDGSNKPPLWDHAIEAAELEIQTEENGYVDVQSFADSNRVMQKTMDTQKGDSRRQEKMITDTPNSKVADKQVQELTQEISALKQQMRSLVPVTYNQNRLADRPSDRSEFSRGNGRPSTPLYESQTCYYCHREGHSTTRCGEMLKDEAQGLVKRNGKDWYLPNGQHIPWNPTRPIRTVVATASADPKMQEAAQEHQNSQPVKTSAQIIEWQPPTLGAENYLKSHPMTRSEAQKGRRNVRIQEPGQEEQMDVDQEEEPETPVRSPARRMVEKVWSKEKGLAGKEKELNPEETLLQELDNVKIPTTFAQLTAISPAYTAQIISKLQSRLPEKSNTTYISTKDTKVATMELNNQEEERDPCYYSCALGYVSAEINGAKVDFMIDSGSMVNVIPTSVAHDLDLEVVAVDIPMKGVGGARCDIKGVVENCPVTIGRFSGPAHLFVSPKAQDCILGRPFLFDYKCMLGYQETGKILTFLGDKGRQVSVPLAKVGQGRGWNNMKDLGANNIRLFGFSLVPQGLKIGQVLLCWIMALTMMIVEGFKGLAKISTSIFKSFNEILSITLSSIGGYVKTGAKKSWELGAELGRPKMEKEELIICRSLSSIKSTSRFSTNQLQHLLANGLQILFQEQLCRNWKDGGLWCLTKYKPVGKKIRPINEAIPQSLNPPLQRPDLS
ncbi:hypothetical protein PTTG_28618 [Puccinia triticina 1-1 BBBD Race 1]|uniref:CCHC-type domain-containing protein n=1 Tax=Puccinia triticina (isolate 1-1 / race 1 (BBBD)) TaxID=630390 RepID=A0A180GAI1_PUCT1|nr:hypothetical protein PTTG_28618 [Puccinia triticina 1-1 BBBD Race 1]